MAKKTKGAADRTKLGSGRGMEGAALGFAEDLGRLLGTTQKKAEEWLGQRKALADRLAQIRDAASGYLQQITGGHGSTAASERQGRRGRPPRSTNKAKNAPATAGKRKRSPMTAAQRKAVGERMKKYWAARKKADTKK